MEKLYCDNFKVFRYIGLFLSIVLVVLFSSIYLQDNILKREGENENFIQDCLDTCILEYGGSEEGCLSICQISDEEIVPEVVFK